MPAGLAQEELQRVGRRLDGEDRRRRRLLRLRLRLGLRRLGVEHLDAALLELRAQGLELERVEPVRLGQLGELFGADAARQLGLLEEALAVVVLEELLHDRDDGRHLHGRCLSRRGRYQTKSTQFQWAAGARPRPGPGHGEFRANHLLRRTAPSVLALYANAR